jgi:hypothetical protein
VLLIFSLVKASQMHATPISNHSLAICLYPIPPSFPFSTKENMRGKTPP